MRNRVIYQTEALYLSYNSTGSMYRDGVVCDNLGIRRNYPWGHVSGNFIEQLQRIQSANYGFTLDRTDVNQYGELSRIASFVQRSPTVTFDFSYYLADAYNELLLNFATDGETNAFYQMMNTQSLPENTTESKNYFILTGPPGHDLNDTDISKNAHEKSVISIGNGFISSYGVSAAIDSMPTATVSVDASTIKSDTGIENILSPGLDLSNGGRNCDFCFSLPDPTSDFVYTALDASDCLTVITGQKALLPGDICINLRDYSAISRQNDLGPTSADPNCLCSGVCSFREGSAHIQSFDINVDFSREQANRLGSTVAYAYFADPLTKVELSVTALVADLKVGDMFDVAYGCSGERRDLDIYFFPPCGTAICNSSGILPNIIYSFRGATITSEAFSSSIGDNKEVTLTFEVPIGSRTEKNVGFFISGSATANEFLLRQNQSTATAECPAFIEQEAFADLFKLENARGK